MGRLFLIIVGLVLVLTVGLVPMLIFGGWLLVVVLSILLVCLVVAATGRGIGAALEGIGSSMSKLRPEYAPSRYQSYDEMHAQEKAERLRRAEFDGECKRWRRWKYDEAVEQAERRYDSKDERQAFLRGFLKPMPRFEPRPRSASDKRWLEDTGGTQGIDWAEVEGHEYPNRDPHASARAD